MQTRFGVVYRNPGRWSNRGEYRLKRNVVAICISRKQVRCCASTARPQRPEARPTMHNRPTGQGRVMIKKQTTFSPPQPPQSLEQKPPLQSSGSPQPSAPSQPPPPPPPPPPQQQTPGFQPPQQLPRQNQRNQVQSNVRGAPRVGQPNNFVSRPQQQQQQPQIQQNKVSKTPPPTIEGNRQQRPPPQQYNQAATKGPRLISRVVMSSNTQTDWQQQQQQIPQQQPGMQGPNIQGGGGGILRSPTGQGPQYPTGQVQRQMGGQSRQNLSTSKPLSSMGGPPGSVQTGTGVQTPPQFQQQGGPPQIQGGLQSGRSPPQAISRQLGSTQQEPRATQDLMAKFGQGAQINQQQRFQRQPISHTQLRSQGNVAFKQQITPMNTGVSTLPTKPPGWTGAGPSPQPPPMSNSGLDSTEAGSQIEQLLAQAGQKNKDLTNKVSQPQARVQSRQGTTLNPFNSRPPSTQPTPPLRQPGSAQPQPRSPQEIIKALQSGKPSQPMTSAQMPAPVRSSAVASPGLQRPGVVPQLDQREIQIPGQMQRPGGVLQSPVQQQVVQSPAPTPTAPVQAPVERPVQKDVSRQPTITPMAEPDPNINYPKSYASNDRLLPINEDIRTPMVRLVSGDQQQLGILPTEEAMALAQEQQVDLLLINQEAKPPVAKLFKYDKFKFEKEKFEKEARKKQRAQQVDTKELKLKPNTDIHDYDVRIKSAKKFLEKGDKVKVTLTFRGREIQFKELADEMLQRFVADVQELATVEKEPAMQGKNLVMILAPISKK